MTETVIEAWPETARVLAEAETVTELTARLVGLVEAFNGVAGDAGVEAGNILSFLEDKNSSVFQDIPAVANALREALARMAPNDPAAQELLAKL